MGEGGRIAPFYPDSGNVDRGGGGRLFLFWKSGGLFLTDGGGGTDLCVPDRYEGVGGGSVSGLRKRLATYLFPLFSNVTA